jgi:hypothetical protein
MKEWKRGIISFCVCVLGCFTFLLPYYNEVYIVVTPIVASLCLILAFMIYPELLIG